MLSSLKAIALLAIPPSTQLAPLPSFCWLDLTSSKEPSWMTNSQSLMSENKRQRSAGITSYSTDGETEAREARDWPSITQ